MKRKVIGGILIFLAVFGAGAALGFYIRSRTLNPRAKFPGVVERLLSVLVKQSTKEDNDILYYDTNLSQFILQGSMKTKISVAGVVDEVTPQPDGDYHVVLRDPVGLALATEFIPEIHLPLPKAGDTVKLWGIVRFDEFHNWWEIHPVIGWEMAK